MIDPIDAIIELETIGFRFWVDGDGIRFKHESERTNFNPVFVRSYFETIKADKAKVIEYLRKPADADDRYGAHENRLGYSDSRCRRRRSVWQCGVPERQRKEKIIWKSE